MAGMQVELVFAALRPAVDPGTVARHVLMVMKWFIHGQLASERTQWYGIVRVASAVQT